MRCTAPCLLRKLLLILLFFDIQISRLVLPDDVSGESFPKIIVQSILDPVEPILPFPVSADIRYEPDDRLVKPLLFFRKFLDPPAFFEMGGLVLVKLTLCVRHKLPVMRPQRPSERPALRLEPALPLTHHVQAFSDQIFVLPCVLHLFLLFCELHPAKQCLDLRDLRLQRIPLHADHIAVAHMKTQLFHKVYDLAGILLVLNARKLPAALRLVRKESVPRLVLRPLHLREQLPEPRDAVLLLLHLVRHKLVLPG